MATCCVQTAASSRRPRPTTRPSPGSANLPTNDWSLYYFRGIALERSNQWPKAELDFKKALELQPNQPYVLNYLGYTWVDKGVHLDEAMAMLKRAVDQKPDDGYIVDSLAWAYYRLGNYDKAVIYQEKAISLDPSDSVLNDHLGDIYWKLGRRDEARFQWQRALAFKPDADQDRAHPGQAAARPRCRQHGRLSRLSVAPSAALRFAARAKINLYLHVTGRRADGYHLLDSLVCFAELGDELALEPAPELRLSLEGPFGTALTGSDNLVLAAARLMDPTKGAALRLVKQLPVASGIGGGSSDAAAALVGLARLWQCPLPATERLLALGADLPVCLAPGPCFVGGIGENLEPAPPLPRFYMLLANPRRPLPTAEVFRRFAGPFSRPATLARSPGRCRTAGRAARRARQRPDRSQRCPCCPKSAISWTRSRAPPAASSPGCRAAEPAASACSPRRTRRPRRPRPSR